jgi:hypothetical protein
VPRRGLDVQSVEPPEERRRREGAIGEAGVHLAPLVPGERAVGELKGGDVCFLSSFWRGGGGRRIGKKGKEKVRKKNERKKKLGFLSTCAKKVERN